MLLCFYVNLRCCTTSFITWTLSLEAWIYGRVKERRSGRCDTCSDLVDFRVNPVWSNADIFFRSSHIWDSNSSPFSCRSFSSQREPTVVGSMIKTMTTIKMLVTMSLIIKIRMEKNILLLDELINENLSCELINPPNPHKRNRIDPHKNTLSDDPKLVTCPRSSSRFKTKPKKMWF